MKNFPRGRFSKSCFFGGGYKLMYTQREDEYQLQVSNFILKIAWLSLIFCKHIVRSENTVNGFQHGERH